MGRDMVSPVFFSPNEKKSESADTRVIVSPTDALIRVTRPDGHSTLLRVPGEHWERVMALAAGEFGDRSIDTSS